MSSPKKKEHGGQGLRALKLRKQLNWFYFSISYLYIARAGCDKFKKITFSTQKSLYISIIFNIKHGLEIFVKYLSLMAINSNLHTTHNLKELFDSFQKKATTGLRSDEKKKVKENIESLYLYVDKYYHLRILNGKLNFEDMLIHDIDNALFRYPESVKVVIDIDYHALITRVEEKDIDDIEADLIDMLDLLLQLEDSLSKIDESNLGRAELKG